MSILFELIPLKSISGRTFFEDFTLTINEVLKRKKSSEYLRHSNSC